MGVPCRHQKKQLCQRRHEPVRGPQRELVRHGEGRWGYIVFMLLATFLTVALTLALNATNLVAADAAPAGGAQAGGKASAKVGSAARQTDMAPALRRAVETQARALLERHLPADSFQVFATVAAKSPAPSPPTYLPSLSPAAFAAMTPEELSPFLGKVEIEVALAARYKANSQTQIKAILTKKMLLDSSRGDQITFSKLTLDLPETRSDIELNLSRVEADGRELKKNLDSASRERDDVKRELAQAKAELSKAQKDPAKTDAASASPSLLQANLPLLLATLLLLALLVLTAVTLRSGLKTLGQAIQSIGNGLPLLGDKIAEARGGSAAPQVVQAALTRSLGGEPEPARIGGPSEPASALSSLPIEALQARIIALNAETLKAFADLGSKAETVALRHISQLLAEPGMVGQAMASLEMLGKDIANSLYHKLGAGQQRLIVAFLQSGHLARPKVEVMLSAGEELKTKLLLEHALGSGRAQLNDKISERLMQFSPEDLTALTLSLNLELLPRFFLYLAPDALAATLSQVYHQNKTKFTEISNVLSTMHAAEKALAADVDLEKEIVAHADTARDDAQRPYLDLYKKLVESVDDSASEGLAKTLAAASPGVGRYLRETVVSFGVLFQLQKDLQEEILDALPNRDLAALLAGLEEAAKTQLGALIGGKRRELIDDEVGRLVSRGTRQVQLACKQAKRDVVARILEAKGTGLVAELLQAGDEDPTSETPPVPHPRKQHNRRDLGRTDHEFRNFSWLCDRSDGVCRLDHHVF